MSLVNELIKGLLPEEKKYIYIGTCMNSFDDYGECKHNAFYDEEHFFNSWAAADEISKEEFWSNIDPSSDKYQEVKKFEADPRYTPEYAYSKEDDIYYIFINDDTHYFFVNPDTLREYRSTPEIEEKIKLENNLSEQGEKKQTTAVYAGGFKPPTSGHFEVVKQALKENPNIDEFIIFIGNKERNGISQDESLLIWEIYNNYLPFKVKIEPTSIPPIKAVYNFAKDHPTREVLWVIGAREGNEEDFKDITSRTSSISKYPNLELRTIVTAGGVSGTAARNASKVSLDKFKKFVPDQLSDEETEEVFNIVADKITEGRKKKKDPKKGTGKKPEGSSRRLYTDEDPKDTVGIKFSTRQDIVDTFNKKSFKAKSHARQSQIINLVHQRVRAAYGRAKDPAVKKRLKTALDYAEERKEASKAKTQRLKKQKTNEAIDSSQFDFSPYIASLTKHMLDNGMKLEPLPTVQMIHDDYENGEYLFGNTAYYNPGNNSVILFTYGRHPKDILRSYAHELVHVHQNMEDRLTGLGANTDVNQDDHLEQIEREAYETGNIMFRSWTDSITGNKLEENLNEGPQFGVLYHYTEYLLDILNNNTLRGPISLTRSRDSFVKVWKGNIPILVLDKDKLRNNYKIRLYQDYDDEGRTADEMEEIIDRDVTNLNKYIVKVILPKPNKEYEDALKEKGIPYEIDKLLNEGKKKDPFGLIAYAQELGRLREEESEYKVYLDMDGVIADFDKRFKDITGMAPKDFENKYGKDEFWKVIDEDNKISFWVGIPEMPGAKALVDAVKKYNFELLTSPSAKKQSYLGKILWVRNHSSLFGGKPRINFKRAKEKHLVKPQLAKTDILIDDREDTIGRWNAAGGTGIVYKNISQVLNDLGKLGL